MAAANPGTVGAGSVQHGPAAKSKAASDALAHTQGGATPQQPVPAYERFIPVTTLALVDRLTGADAWPEGHHQQARRFFRYLDFWRRQQHSRKLMSLLRAYEPFDPDSDLLITRQYTPDEKKRLQKRTVSDVKRVLERANYVAIDPKSVELILTKDSHYGLDLQVDLGVFEECLLYYRGKSTKRDKRTNYRKFLRKEEFDVPIYRRLLLLFKLKPFDVRVREIMAEKNLSEKEAAKVVARLRGSLPVEVKEDNIYIKLFKNIPRNDLEMVFPNTRVRFRLLDKIKLGVTGGGAVGMGLFGTAGKLAAGGLTVANPIALMGALAGLGGIAFRQGVNFFNQKQRYMVVMAQNLYFHAMADNRGVLIKLGERGAEEDVKEEILLYSVLAKEKCKRSDLDHIDAAIESYLMKTFAIRVDFDLPDALERLLADGIVTEDADGTLLTLQPAEAAQLLDRKWDRFLDDLPDGTKPEGLEIDAEDFPHL
ncbi:MAG: TMEM143 family protein [Hyphomicrobium sp.]|jgi:hypothetical protein|nr:TMEM143 family protein [Hyphomicrobium sp.]